MQMIHILFYIILTAYVITVITHFAGVGFKNDTIKKVAFIAFSVTTVAHLGYFIFRWWVKVDLLDIGVLNALPVRGAFEYGMSFALLISIFCIVARSKMPWIVSAAIPASLALMLFSATRNMDINEMIPALRSPWLFVHAGTGVVAYAAFAIAAVAGIKYLINLKKGEPEDNKTMIQIDKLAYRVIVFGMLFFTVTIITGSMWAADAWSRFWFWDPKELWSLITWIFYAIYLHQRLRLNWRGKRCAILAIVGVGLVLFTWIGVNNLLAGLHSYA